MQFSTSVKYLLAFFILIVANTSNVQSSANPTITTIPFRLIDDIIYIDVKVNDADSLHFIFDTGATSTIVSKSVGDRLQLFGGGQGSGLGAAGSYDVEVYANNTIQLGDLSLENITVIKHEGSLESTVFGESLDGIIGYDIFVNYVVEIDYDELLISFSTPHQFEYSGSGQTIPIQFFSGLPYIPFSVVINGTTYEGDYIIDTGAQLELLFTSPFIDQHDILSQLDQQIELSKNIGLSGEKILLILSKIDQVDVFDHRFNSVPIVTSEINQAIFGVPQIAGIIGNGLMKRFNTIYNYADQEIYIQPNKAILEPYYSDCLGASFEKQFEYRRLVIESIIAESAAEKAGLMIGDEILSIDKIPLQRLTNNQLRSIVESDGKEIELLYLRDGVPYPLKVKLKKLL